MSLVALITSLIHSDDTDDSDRLAARYDEANAEERSAIDGVMIALCGYSLQTLMTWCKCGNCGHECPRDDLKEIRDLEERMDHPPGHPERKEPAGECPECGALSYTLPIEEEE